MAYWTIILKRCWQFSIFITWLKNRRWYFSYLGFILVFGYLSFHFTIASLFISKGSRGCIFATEKKRQQYFAYLWNDCYFFSNCAKLLLLSRLVWVPAGSSSAAPSRRAASAAAAATAAPKTATWPSSSSWRCGAVPKDPPGRRRSFWHCRDPGDHTLDTTPFLKQGAQTCCRADFVDQVVC